MEERLCRCGKQSNGGDACVERLEIFLRLPLQAGSFAGEAEPAVFVLAQVVVRQQLKMRCRGKVQLVAHKMRDGLHRFRIVVEPGMSGVRKRMGLPVCTRRRAFSRMCALEIFVPRRCCASSMHLRS